MGPVLAAGYTPPEVTYDFDRPGARYELGQPIPWLLTCTLPRLSSDPDQLFDEIHDYCVALDDARPSQLARSLFDWLTRTLMKEVWVERSGAAISYLDDLDREFPDGRFLHLHRQGEEAALSIREHPVFRIGAMLTYNIPIGEGGSTRQLAELSEDASHIEKLLASRPSPTHFGRWWSSQLLAGFGTVGSLPPNRYEELPFESLLSDPASCLQHAAEFLELPDTGGAWREEAALLIDGSSKGRFDQLPAEEKTALSWSCEPGNRLLRRSALSATGL